MNSLCLTLLAEICAATGRECSVAVGLHWFPDRAPDVIYSILVPNGGKPAIKATFRVGGCERTSFAAAGGDYDREAFQDLLKKIMAQL